MRPPTPLSDGSHALRRAVWHSARKPSRTSADALASLRAVYRSVTACGRRALPIAQAIGLRNDLESAMKTRCGHPRKLSDREILEVMKWHQEAIEFRRAHGTLRGVAILLGVSVHAVRGCLENRIPGTSNADGIQAIGRRGRPRHLSPAQIRFVIAWHETGRRFYARHGSIAGLARRLGVSASTIHDCIRREGRYRQRADADASKSQRAGRNQLPMRDNARRSALLRAWPRPQRKLTR